MKDKYSFISSEGINFYLLFARCFVSYLLLCLFDKLLCDFWHNQEEKLPRHNIIFFSVIIFFL
ncbi:hypothetical protein M153_2700005199 [Pseudoloma neurophilia]|uniref:Uncharacterized protein n=1 Tax=Pseudoloma neurophilia TaxID=146866 RepID=A0A0R0LYK2_9MICR|nr:hypothetical protein M153_2700005199 [Pseudoloma neurophilia]